MERLYSTPKSNAAVHYGLLRDKEQLQARIRTLCSMDRVAVLRRTALAEISTGPSERPTGYHRGVADRGASRLNQIRCAPRGSPARRSQVQLRIAWPSTSAARTQPRVACGLKGQLSIELLVTVCRKDPDFANTQRGSGDATLHGSREVVTEGLEKTSIQMRCKLWVCGSMGARGVTHPSGSGQLRRWHRERSSRPEVRDRPAQLPKSAPSVWWRYNSPLTLCGCIVHTTASSGIRSRVPRAKGVLGVGILRRQAGFTLQGILPHADQQAVATIRRAVRSSKPQQSP